MTLLLDLLDTLLRLLRSGFLVAAAGLGIVCLVDWMVRTRRLNPFGGVARFMRRTVDPLLTPVERRIVRAGGNPASAPWWALVGAVVGGIVVLSLLDFVRQQLVTVLFAWQAGLPGLLRVLVAWTFEALKLALLVRVLSSWIRVSPYSRWVRWSFALSEPLLAPLRGVVPAFGMIDLTPVVAYFLLGLVQSFVLGLV